MHYCAHIHTLYTWIPPLSLSLSLVIYSNMQNLSLVNLATTSICHCPSIWVNQL